MDQDTQKGVTQEAASIEDQINAVGMGRFQVVLILIVTLLFIAEGMEIVVVSLLSSPLQKEWGSSTVEIGALSSATFIGILSGSLICSLYGDHYGRRSTVLFGASIFLVASIISAIAPSLLYLCAIRFALGIGFGIFVPTLMCTFGELVPTKNRAFYTLFLSGVAWATGEIIICIVAIVLNRIFSEIGSWWRLVLLFSSIPGLIGVVLAAAYLPESPHYLSVHGRHEEAIALLRRMAEENGCSGSLLHNGRIREVRAQSRN